MELRNFRKQRHLHSAGRPSRWASAHILVIGLGLLLLLLLLGLVAYCGGGRDNGVLVVVVVVVLTVVSIQSNIKMQYA